MLTKAFSFCFLLCFCLPANVRGQDSAAGATAFPEKLLEGANKFNLALLVQADIRGNFGPCG